MFILLFCTWIKGLGQASAVANLAQNLVYIGLANPFIVIAEQHPCESIVVTTDNGRLEKMEHPCQYHYLPEKEGKGTITIQTIKNGDTLRIGEHLFRVKSLPDPIPTVGGKSTGFISRSVLKVQSGIPAITYFGPCARFEVTGFTLIAQKANGMHIILSAQGALFTEALKQQFYLLTPKDRVIFANIKATGPDGRIRLLTPIELTIE